jgi:hypothetical protein
MLQEEFDRGLECALFACFDLLIGEISTDCKAVLAALKVLPPVPRCELSPTENPICLRLRLKGELFVKELIRRGALEIDAYFWLGGMNLLYTMRKTVAPQGLQGSSEATGAQQRSTE